MFYIIFVYYTTSDNVCVYIYIYYTLYYIILYYAILHYILYVL